MPGDVERTTNEICVETPNGVDCEQAVHELYHYLDGELTITRRGEIAMHLDRCGPCAGAAEFEAELRQVIANHCRDRVPESLRQRIAASIHEEQHRHGPDRTGTT